MHLVVKLIILGAFCVRFFFIQMEEHLSGLHNYTDDELDPENYKKIMKEFTRLDKMIQ